MAYSFAHWTSKKPHHLNRDPIKHFRKAKSGVWVEYDNDDTKKQLHKYSPRMHQSNVDDGEIILFDDIRQISLRLTPNRCYLKEMRQSTWSPLHIGGWVDQDTPQDTFQRPGYTKSGLGANYKDDAVGNHSSLSVDDQNFIGAYRAELLNKSRALHWLATSASVRDGGILVPLELRYPSVLRDGTGGYSKAFGACGLKRPDEFIQSRKFHSWKVTPARLDQIQTTLQRFISHLTSSSNLRSDGHHDTFLNRHRQKDDFDGFTRSRLTERERKPDLPGNRIPPQEAPASRFQKLQSFGTKLKEGIKESIFSSSRGVASSTSSRELPFMEDGITYLELGRIPNNPEKFHSESYIYPIGFSSKRLHNSYRSTGTRVVYKCSIELQPSVNRPMFIIVPEDDRDNPVNASSASQALKYIENRIADHSHVMRSPKLSDGEEFFGLNGIAVVRMIEHLHNAENCARYKFKYRRSTGALNHQKKTSDGKHTENAYYRILFDNQDQFTYKNGALRWLLVFCSQNASKQDVRQMQVPLMKRHPEGYDAVLGRLGFAQSYFSDSGTYNVGDVNLVELRKALRRITQDVPATETYKNPFRQPANKPPTRVNLDEKVQCDICHKKFSKNFISTHKKNSHGASEFASPAALSPFETPLTPLTKMRKRTRAIALSQHETPTMPRSLFDTPSKKHKPAAFRESPDLFATNSKRTLATISETNTAGRQTNINTNPLAQRVDLNQTALENPLETLARYENEISEADQNTEEVINKRSQLDTEQMKLSSFKKRVELKKQRLLSNLDQKKPQGESHYYSGVCAKWDILTDEGVIQFSNKRGESFSVKVSKFFLKDTSARLEVGVKVKFRLGADENREYRAEDVEVTSYRSGSGLTNFDSLDGGWDIAKKSEAVQNKLDTVEELAAKMKMAESYMNNAAKQQHYKDAQRYKNKLGEYKKRMLRARELEKQNQAAKRTREEAQNYKSTISCPDYPTFSHGSDLDKFRQNKRRLIIYPYAVNSAGSSKNNTLCESPEFDNKLATMMKDEHKLRQKLQHAKSSGITGTDKMDIDMDENTYKYKSREAQLRKEYFNIGRKKDQLVQQHRFQEAQNCQDQLLKIEDEVGELRQRMKSNSADLWPCPQCTFDNKQHFERCEMCQCGKPKSLASKQRTYHGKITSLDAGRKRAYLSSPSFKDSLLIDRETGYGIDSLGAGDSVSFSVLANDEKRKARNVTPIKRYLGL